MRAMPDGGGTRVSHAATKPAQAGRDIAVGGTGAAARHLLMVAFHYPPEASSSGVLRALKFSRYLPEFGWRVSVLTVAADAYEQTDAGLAAQIPDSVRVLRTRYLNTKRHLAVRGVYPSVLAVPDRWIGWYPWARAAGERLFAEDPPDAILSTSPHPTAHLIAARLVRAHDRPWVMDFRDPWYEEPPEPDTPATVHRAARWLERRTVHRASRVVGAPVNGKHVLHLRHKPSALLRRDHPLPGAMRLEPVFLSVCRTVSWLRVSTTPSSTMRSAKRRRLHWLWPSGASEQARRTSSASCSPSSFRS